MLARQTEKPKEQRPVQKQIEKPKESKPSEKGAEKRKEQTVEYVDDTVTTTQVKSLLAADGFLKSFQINVETHQGSVQLSGVVDSKKAADQAGKIARGVKGVKSVRNDLIVK
jgi:osmotically-inducible protein OsmY